MQCAVSCTAVRQAPSDLWPARAGAQRGVRCGRECSGACGAVGTAGVCFCRGLLLLGSTPARVGLRTWMKSAM
eukprot:scaffold10321_cov122-Isochrysis_galbana.AAC.1